MGQIKSRLSLCYIIFAYLLPNELDIQMHTYYYYHLKTYLKESNFKHTQRYPSISYVKCMGPFKNDAVLPFTKAGKRGQLLTLSKLKITGLFSE